MKRKLTLTIDPDVYDQLGELPRKVSISEVANWMLKALITDIRGMSDEEFKKLMESDPRGREVRAYLKDKLGPFLNRVEPYVNALEKPIGYERKVVKKKK